MDEQIIGFRKSYKSKKYCRQGCGNIHWIVSRTSDNRYWWLCPKCGARQPYRPKSVPPKGVNAFAEVLAT
jgi:hypothetical protein